MHIPSTYGSWRNLRILYTFHRLRIYQSITVLFDLGNSDLLIEVKHSAGSGTSRSLIKFVVGTVTIGNPMPVGLYILAESAVRLEFNFSHFFDVAGGI